MIMNLILGHFRGAVRPEIENFRDLPEWIRENKEQFEGKKILTYCTGGIRCEKFSGWLVREGFEDVSQFTAELSRTEKILLPKVNFGMDNVTYLTNELLFQSIKWSM